MDTFTVEDFVLVVGILEGVLKSFLEKNKMLQARIDELEWEREEILQLDR